MLLEKKETDLQGKHVDKNGRDVLLHLDLASRAAATGKWLTPTNLACGKLDPPRPSEDGDLCHSPEKKKKAGHGTWATPTSTLEGIISPVA